MREHGSLQGYPTLRDSKKEEEEEEEENRRECAENPISRPPSYLSQVFKRFLLG